ncbi:MAG: hypothetical protein ABIO55_03655 [Ginsengibacter sp.]
MLSIIISYLVQTGKCELPYFGVFTFETRAAKTDIVNKQILPPSEELVFTEEAILSTTYGLVKYLALKKNIAESAAEKELDLFCKEWKEKVNAGEKFCFETFGCLQKNEEDIISFSRADNISFYKAVPADRVLHQHTEHAVLVGDIQTTSAEMNKYYSGEAVVEKRAWYVWALTLFIIGVVILFYSFYNYKFSPSSIGNRSHFTVKTAGETHAGLSK